MDQRAFIGIGSNIGNSANNCLTAIESLSSDKRARFLARSSLYVTSPVSSIAQDDFINCAVCVMWNDSPLNLLTLLNNIEEMMGRERVVKHGPRIIDLDILLFGDLMLDTHSLKIPHPELHKRRFAIVPCIEIDPALIHPRYKRLLKDFLADIGDEQQIRILG